jgi:Putative Actinobacterial Holin-X, holin superfamily III
MATPRVDQLSERPLEGLAQTVSEQALVLARQQVDLARRGLATRAKEAGPGAAMVGGGAFLGVIASGTGTAALVLLLAGRARTSAAAFGVTGAYAGAGALLARQGLIRLREGGSLMPEEAVQEAKPAKAIPSAKPQEAVQDTKPADVVQDAKPQTAARSAKKTVGSATRGGKSAAKAAGRSKPRPRDSTKPQQAAARKQSERVRRSAPQGDS